MFSTHLISDASYTTVDNNDTTGDRWYDISLDLDDSKDNKVDVTLTKVNDLSNLVAGGNSSGGLRRKESSDAELYPCVFLFCYLLNLEIRIKMIYVYFVELER